MKEYPRSYDLIGDIAILKFPENFKEAEKKKIAKKLLAENLRVKTVLEKAEKVKGRLRTIKTNYLAGEDKKETIHKENNCIFKVNVESCYFSPRLSEERKIIADKIKKNTTLLIMFAGVSPYAIVIAKKVKVKKIVSIELGRECCKYGKENVKLNKLANVEIVQGDIKRVVDGKEKFDYVIMPRPQLKENFLKQAFMSSKKGTVIFFRAFGKEEDKQKIIEMIKSEAEKYKKKIKILDEKKAGEIAPYKFRWMVEFKILN
jgi:tRNA (guanine37-N1)-methyltransferase